MAKHEKPTWRPTANEITRFHDAFSLLLTFFLRCTRVVGRRYDRRKSWREACTPPWMTKSLSTLSLLSHFCFPHPFFYCFLLTAVRYFDVWAQGMDERGQIADRGLNWENGQSKFLRRARRKVFTNRSLTQKKGNKREKEQTRKKGKE